jgi:hypothetical protein
MAPKSENFGFLALLNRTMLRCHQSFPNNFTAFNAPKTYTKENNHCWFVLPAIPSLET